MFKSALASLSRRARMEKSLVRRQHTRIIQAVEHRHGPITAERLDEIIDAICAPAPSAPAPNKPAIEAPAGNIPSDIHRQIESELEMLETLSAQTEAGTSPVAQIEEGAPRAVKRPHRWQPGVSRDNSRPPRIDQVTLMGLREGGVSYHEVMTELQITADNATVTLDKAEKRGYLMKTSLDQKPVRRVPTATGMQRLREVGLLAA